MQPRPRADTMGPVLPSRRVVMFDITCGQPHDSCRVDEVYLG